MTDTLRQSFWHGLIIGLVLPIIAGLLLAVLVAGNEQFDRPVAEQFFADYWSSATKDPDETWMLLTDDFRSKRRLDLGAYKADMMKYRAVEVEELRYSERLNYFEMQLVFHLADSDTAVRESLTYGIQCRSWLRDHMPWMKCRAGDLVIFDGYRN